MKTSIFCFVVILVLSYLSCESEADNMSVAEQWSAYKVIYQIIYKLRY